MPCPRRANARHEWSATTKYLAAAAYHIPIVFITAYADEEIRAQALEAGAVAFLTKPFGEEALLKGIRSALKLTEGDTTP